MTPAAVAPSWRQRTTRASWTWGAPKGVSDEPSHFHRPEITTAVATPVDAPTCERPLAPIASLRGVVSD